MRKVWRSYSIGLFLLISMFVSIIRIRAEQQSLYATLGTESYSILRELVGTQHVISIQIGTMSTVLNQNKVTALVVPENRQNDPDVIFARKAGIPIVTVLRHTNIANITSNILSLGTLTDHEEKARRWINRINATLNDLQHDLAAVPQTRVLILSPEGYTQGQGALITNLLSQVKGINVAAEAGIPEARQISDEQIRQFAPDVVLLLNWSPEAANNLMSNSLYNGIPAFDHQRIYRINTPGKDVIRLTNDLRTLADLIQVWTL